MPVDLSYFDDFGQNNIDNDVVEPDVYGTLVLSSRYPIHILAKICLLFIAKAPTGFYHKCRPLDDLVFESLA